MEHEDVKRVLFEEAGAIAESVCVVADIAQTEPCALIMAGIMVMCAGARVSGEVGPPVGISTLVHDLQTYARSLGLPETDGLGPLGAEEQETVKRLLSDALRPMEGES